MTGNVDVPLRSARGERLCPHAKHDGKVVRPYCLGIFRILSCLLAAVVLAPLSVCADGPSDSIPGIQRVLVPIDKLKDYLSRSKTSALWPEGGWQAVDRRDFDALMRAAGRKRLPQDVWIQNAEYRAVFADGKLRQGALQASLKHFGSEKQLVSLEPLRLAVSELRLGGADAVWGTTSAGELGLLAEPSQTALEARWSLAGRSLPRSVEFDVGLLPATVSRMILQVPDGYEVSCAPGNVEKTGPAENADWWLWQVDLGAHSRCKLRIVRSADAPQFQQPVVLETSETSYIVRESGVEIRQDFQCDVLRAPVARLRFLAPRDFEVHSVTYGAESPLPWRSTTEQNGQRLDLDLVDPLLGRSRPVSVRGFMPHQFGRRWLLKRLSLRNGVSTGDRVHIRIARPLVLRDVDAGGYHQTRMLADDEGETFTFERIAPGPMPTIDVDFPPAHLSAASVSHLNVEGDVWQLTADVTWTVRNGSTFVTRCRVPAGWNVTDVQVPADADGTGLTGWKVVRRRKSGQELVIEFPNALEPGREKTIQVVARRTGARNGQRIGLPTICAVDALSSEVVLIVSHSNRSIPRTIGPSLLFRTTAAELPDRFQNSPLLQAAVDGPQGGRSYFFGRMSQDAAGGFSLDPIAPSTDVDAHVVARLSSSELVEQVLLKCRTTDGSVDRLIVQLTSDGSPFTWALQEEPESSLAPRRLDDANVANGEKVATPDVHDWEFRFDEPQSGEFALTATRSRPITSGTSLALAYVPQARRFRGEFELRIDSGINSSVLTTALDPVQDATAQKWRYQDATARILIRTTESSEVPRARGLASLNLHSVIAPVEGGRDVHRARFVTLGSERETFAFQLPRIAKLVEVRADGRPAQSIRKADEWLVPPLSGQPFTEFEVHYETPSQGGRLWTARRIAVPKTRHSVVDFRWEFVLPPGRQLTDGPQGIVLTDPLPSSSLLKRVFGPLGRASGEPVFNPFLKESWLRWLRSDRRVSRPPPSSSNRSSSDSLKAQGWTVWHAVGPEAPAVLTLKTCNAHGARLCAWAAFFGSLILGLGFRIRGGAQSPTPSRSLAAYWFGGCVVVALLAPPVYAEIAGGCVCGWLLAVLLPHGLLRSWQFAPGDKHGVRMGSTVNAPEALATSLLIAMLWVANGAAAQVPSTDDTAETTARPDVVTPASDKLQDLRVVVPVGRDLQPATSARFVYATQGALDRLQQLREQPDEQSRYLILSANYDGTVDADGAVAMNADYRIAVLNRRRATQVRLPIGGAHLSGPRECLVEGEPVTVVRGSQAGEFLVEVRPDDVGPAIAPKPLQQQQGEPSEFTTRRPARIAERLVNIRLRLRPTVADVGNRSRFQVTLPSVGNGSLSLEFPRTGLDVAITGRVAGTSQDLMRLTNDSRRVSCPLGWADQVSVSWSNAPNGALEASPAVATVEAACLVEAQPSRLTLHVRAEYALNSGTVDYLVWRIPRNAVPRRVLVDDAAARFTMTGVRGPNADCMIELPEPRNTGFTVVARFTLPLPSVRSVLSLPALDLFAADPAPGTVELTDIVEMSFAISAASNDRIAAVAGRAEDLPMRMNVPESLISWARELGVREPQTAFELARPNRLEIRLEPLSAERIVHLRQTGTVDANSLTWTAEADVETSPPGVFQHVLEVDERLDVESVSVTEDEAERLVRWSSTGNRVVLFLSGRTTGLQTVKLVGRLPCPSGEDVTLPSVRVADARTVASTMWLQHDRDVDIDIVGSPDEDVDAVDSFASAGDDGSLQATIGPFEFGGDVPPMQVRIVPQLEVVRSETVSLLEQRSGGRWDLTQVFNFGRTLSVGSQVSLKVPPELTERIELLPEGLRQDALSPANGSVVRFAVAAGPVPAEGYRIVATARHLQPAQVGLWRVPHVTVQNADETAQFLLLSPAGSFQAANVGTYQIDDYDLPVWFPIDDEEAIETTEWDAFRIDGTWPPLVPVPAHDEGKVAQVPLFETRVWLENSGKQHGQTALLLDSGAEAVLRLKWPRACLLKGLTIDGHQVRALEPEGGTFAIPLTLPNSVLMVNIYWELPAQEGLTRFGTVLMTYPSPQDLTVGTSLLTVAGPETRHVMPRGELAPHNTVEHALDRMSALVAALRGGRLEQRNRRLLWSFMQQESRRLAQRLTHNPAGDKEAWKNQWQRYRKLAADLDSLRPADQPPESVPADLEFHIAGSAAISTSAEGMLLGRLPSRDPVPEFSLWVIDETVLNVLTATLCLLVVLPVARAWVGWRRSWWADTRAWTAWAILAIIWWTCLTPSILGLLLLPCAAWYALRRPQATLEPAEFVLRPSAVTSPESTSGLEFHQL